jgi:hypothetical protein
MSTSEFKQLNLSLSETDRQLIDAALTAVQEHEQQERRPAR